MGIEGKVVVITGGTRGIGRAVAENCARDGAHVVLCSRQADMVASAEGEIRGSVTGVCADVSRYADVERLRDTALERHDRIDVWFNNAGISLGYRPLDEEAPGDLARIVDINLTGHLYGCRAILPYFRENGGYVMNMAGRGYKGEATAHTAAYAATKTAIVSLTRSLAAENKRVEGLSINAIVPGMVDTDFYRDISISPRLEPTKDNWRYALDAFGVPIDRVAEEITERLGDVPGVQTGRVYSLLTPARTARGVAKMAWWGMTGKMRRE